MRVLRLTAATLIVAGTTMAAACSNSQTDTGEPAVQSAAPADTANGGSVSGRIPAAEPGTIVVLTPATARAWPPPTATPVMDQVQMTFVPEVMISRAGFPVAFHSNDSELHNINVRNPEKRNGELNRSIPPGVTFEHVFNEAGFYNVRCDIHPGMAAMIFVVDTPLAQSVDAGGAFDFENVPPGTYTLTVYNGASTTTQQVEVTEGENQVRVGAA